MADNYLEKQREQYEARKAAWLKTQKLGKKKKTDVQRSKSTSSADSTPKDMPEDSSSK